MSEHGTIPEPAAVRFERLLPGPIDRVWAFLTEPEKRKTWLASGPMEVRSGGAFEFIWRNSELSPRKEKVPEKYRKYEPEARMSGHILRCEPPRFLSHTWSDGSEVSYELTPRGSSVLLVLVHRRIASRNNMLGVSGGWHAHLDILVDILEGREPRPFWSTHAALETEYEKRLPADAVPKPRGSRKE